MFRIFQTIRDVNLKRDAEVISIDNSVKKIKIKYDDDKTVGWINMFDAIGYNSPLKIGKVNGKS